MDGGIDEKRFLLSYYIHPFDQESLGMWGFFVCLFVCLGKWKGGSAFSIWTAVNE
jgi:hypothetical protein